ncbi:GreA/GreB family elongation factor [Microtetraspora niveoalba]|uniref:GreA/GreB family elongation factor n=1 Tax=Microtetraspora niveoalba TaxID=46175 RepID=UPI00083137EE|nr:GreA/GreB family elongation factor [Microtetraspora niveoalba]
MTSTQRTWLTQNAYDRLREELAGLLAHRAGEGDGAPPHDPDSNEEIMERERRQARIHQIEDLLKNAVVGEDPPDDGVAEPGMVLTVRYDGDEETETFLMGLRDESVGGDIPVYSPNSPLGLALTGAREGEQRTYELPNGRTMRVTLVKAVPYGHHSAH